MPAPRSRGQVGWAVLHWCTDKFPATPISFLSNTHTRTHMHNHKHLQRVQELCNATTARHVPWTVSTPPCEQFQHYPEEHWSIFMDACWYTVSYLHACSTVKNESLLYTTAMCHHWVKLGRHRTTTHTKHVHVMVTSKSWVAWVWLHRNNTQLPCRSLQLQSCTLDTRSSQPLNQVGSRVVL